VADGYGDVPAADDSHRLPPDHPEHWWFGVWKNYNGPRANLFPVRGHGSAWLFLAAR